MASTLVYLTPNTITATLLDSDGAGVTGATVTVTLEDTAGNEIAEQTWPLTLSDDGAGVYSGTLESDIDVVPTQTVVADVTAVVGGLTVANVREDVLVQQDTT